MSDFSRFKIAKQIFGTSGVGAVGQIASFIGVVTYTQLVSQSVLGSYFLLIAILEIISFIGAKGVSSDITRQIPKSNTPEKELSTAASLILIITLCFTLSTLLVIPIFNSYLESEIGSSLLFLLPQSILMLFTNSVLEGEKKNTCAMGFVTLRKISTYLIGSLAVLSGMGAETGLVFGAFCGRAFQLLGGVIVIDTVPDGLPKFSAIRQLASRVASLTLVGLGNLGQQWIDTLLIGAFLTPAAVAIYEVAWRLSATGVSVTNAVTSVLYPRFAEAVDKENHTQITRYTHKALFYVSAPMIALLAGAAALGSDLITILYGSEYSVAYIPLLILLAGRISYSFSRISTVLGFSYNLDRGVTIASFGAAVLNASVNLFLIPFVGIVGAAIGSFLSYTALAASLFYLLSDHVEYPRPMQFAPSVAASIVMLLSVHALSASLQPDISNLLLLVSLGGVVFAVVLLLVSPEVRSDLKRITS